MMSYLAFSILLGAIFLEGFCGVYLSSIPGLSLRNIAVYAGVLISLFKCRRESVHIPFLGFFGVILLWSVVSLVCVQYLTAIPIEVGEHLRALKDRVIFPMLFFVFGVCLCDNERTAKKLLLALLMSFLLISIVSLFSGLLGMRFFSTSMFYNESGRYTGLGNPNKSAYYYVFIAPLYYYVYRYAKNRVVGILCVLGLIFVLLGVVLAGSRGAMVSLVASMGLITWKMRDVRIPILLAFSLVAVIPFVLASQVLMGYVGKFMERVSVLWTGHDIAVISSYRSVIWPALLQEFTSSVASVLFGKGFHSTTYFGVHAPAHNWYLRQLVEFGSCGLGFAFWFFSRVVSHIRKLGEGINKPFGDLFVIACFSIAIDFLFSTLSGMTVLLAFSFGLMMGFLHQRNSASSSYF